jgi:hypothetical protein
MGVSSVIVGLMVMDRERNMTLIGGGPSFGIVHTTELLFNLSYEFSVVRAVDGLTLHQDNLVLGDIKFELNSAFSKPGQIGCWLSHVKVWRMGARLKKNVISLESDTVPTGVWHLSNHEWDQLDLVAVHESHDGRLNTARKLCTEWTRSNPGVQVRLGYSALQKTGAFFFNWKRSKWIHKIITETPINLPLDHWLARESATGRLRIGTLCAPLFKQYNRKSRNGQTKTWSKTTELVDSEHFDALD